MDECHKRDIAVLGDMVLNHAFGTNPHGRMYWDDILNRPASNNPWFNEVSNFNNPGAQWGNDFNHESLHTQALADSIVKYWIQEFKIDGIRFDFTKGVGNTPYPNDNCGDIWGGCYDARRITLLKRLANTVWATKNGTSEHPPYVMFEHLANTEEDAELSNYGYGINMWCGQETNSRYSTVAEGWTGTDLGIAYYRNRSFNQPTWVSYMESHDEERLAYKQILYGNGNIKTDLSLRSQFLQTAAVMNLLFPGPRQIWQFGELGYDYSINYNGRTGRKPVRWDYFDVPERKKIYETYSRLLYLRNRFPKTFHNDFDNPTGMKLDLASQFKRYHYYSSVGDTAVTVIANTANSVISGKPDFNGSTANQWYEYFSNSWQVVSNDITLQPGEFRIYFNKKPRVEQPKFSLSAAANDSTAYDSTKISIYFSEAILKITSSSALGTSINTANAANCFILKDASGKEQTFSINKNVSESAFTLTLNQKLLPGKYTLTLVGDSLQNYGGLALDSLIIFKFSIIDPSKDDDCQSRLVITHNYESGKTTKKSSGTIQATNKVTKTARVFYQSKNQTTLEPGFLALPNSGGVFCIEILDPCH